MHLERHALFRVLREKQAECQNGKHVSNEQMWPFALVIASECPLNDKGQQNKFNSDRIVLYRNRFQGESFWFLPQAQ